MKDLPAKYRVVPVVIEISEGFLHDVLVVAAEGGINYWAQLEEYDWTDRGGPDKDEFRVEVLRVRDTMNPKARPRFVTTRTVLKGIRRILSGKVRTGPGIYRDIHEAVTTQDPGCIDAPAADCIVQAGLFNDITYS